MKTIEPYVKKWYDGLEEGKFLATRCKKCGAFEFPPLPICNTCGTHDMEWVEISGKGELIAGSTPDVPLKGPEEGLLSNGVVKLEEGPSFIGWLVDLTEEDRENLFDMVPCPVEMVTIQRNGFKYPGFKLVK